MMKFSLRLNNDLPVAEYVALARVAEDAGFDQFWVSNDLFLRSVPVILTAVAQATERIEIGTCVVNPYTMHPAEIAMLAATLDEVNAFHSRYYMPNNAVLSIVGDVEEAAAFARADHFFGGIAPGEPPPRTRTAPLPPVAEQAVRSTADDVPAPALWLAARLPADNGRSRELAAVEIASTILGDGETSRLHRRLVRQDELALSAGMGVNTLVAGNSLGAVSVRALPGVDLDIVKDAVADVLGAFAAGGPSDLELTIARSQSERSWLDEMATAGGRADALSGCALLYDDPRLLNERLPLLLSVTAEEVRAAAERWLLPAGRAELRVEPRPGSAENVPDGEDDLDEGDAA